MLTIESIDNSLEAAKLVTHFCHHIDTMREMVDNGMLKDNEKFKDISEIHRDAYYSTIFYCSDVDIKIKAINLLGCTEEDWFPEIDKKMMAQNQA